MRTNNPAVQWLLLLLVIFCLSCKKGRPERKKLPDSVSLYSWEGVYLYATEKLIDEQVPFYCRDTTIRGLKYFLLALGDEQDDSVALNIAKTYERVADNIYEVLEQEKEKGAVIDLRNPQPQKWSEENGNMSKRSFIITDQANLKNVMKVIFLWDDNSSYRAAHFITELLQLPAIKYCIEEDDHNKIGLDCFRETKSEFETP